MSFEDMNNIVKAVEKLTPQQLASIENGQAVPVKALSGPSRHYQKNLLKKMRQNLLSRFLPIMLTIYSKLEMTNIQAQNIFLINGS